MKRFITRKKTRKKDEREAGRGLLEVIATQSDSGIKSRGCSLPASATQSLTLIANVDELSSSDSSTKSRIRHHRPSSINYRHLEDSSSSDQDDDDCFVAYEPEPEELQQREDEPLMFYFNRMHFLLADMGIDFDSSAAVDYIINGMTTDLSASLPTRARQLHTTMDLVWELKELDEHLRPPKDRYEESDYGSSFESGTRRERRCWTCGSPDHWEFNCPNGRFGEDRRNCQEDEGDEQLDGGVEPEHRLDESSWLWA